MPGYGRIDASDYSSPALGSVEYMHLEGGRTLFSPPTFEVLPHFTEELYNDMAMLAAGEDTNTFKQEYWQSCWTDG